MAVDMTQPTTIVKASPKQMGVAFVGLTLLALGLTGAKMAAEGTLSAGRRVAASVKQGNAQSEGGLW